MEHPCNERIYAQTNREIDAAFNTHTDTAERRLLLQHIAKGILITVKEREKARIEAELDVARKEIMQLLEQAYGPMIAWRGQEKYSLSNFRLTWLPDLEIVEVRLMDRDKETGRETESSVLDLSGVEFKEDIPLNILRHLRVENVNISGCGVSELGTLPETMKVLDCSNNKLQNLQGTKELEELYCGGNQLTRIVDDMQQLRILHCPNNKLTVLPKTFNLEELDCSNNKIQTLTRIGRAKKVLCANNELRNIDVLPAVEVLDCSYNKVLSILPSMNALKELYVTGTSVMARYVEDLRLKGITVYNA